MQKRARAPWRDSFLWKDGGETTRRKNGVALMMMKRRSCLPIAAHVKCANVNQLFKSLFSVIVAGILSSELNPPHGDPNREPYIRVSTLRAPSHLVASHTVLGVAVASSVRCSRVVFILPFCSLLSICAHFFLTLVMPLLFIRHRIDGKCVRPDFFFFFRCHAPGEYSPYKWIEITHIQMAEGSVCTWATRVECTQHGIQKDRKFKCTFLSREPKNDWWCAWLRGAEIHTLCARPGVVSANASDQKWNFFLFSKRSEKWHSPHAKVNCRRFAGA